VLLVFLPLAVLIWIWVVAIDLGGARLSGALKAIALALRRGMPLPEILSAVARETGGKVRRRCLRGLALADSGDTVEASLSGLLALLPKDLRGSVETFAGAPALAASLEDVADRLSSRQEARSDLALDLVYPAALGLLLSAVLGFYCVFIDPLWRQMFTEMGMGAPFSQGFLNGGILVLVSIVALSLAMLAAVLWPRLSQGAWGFFSRRVAAVLQVRGDLPARMETLSKEAPWARLRKTASEVAAGLREGRSLPDLVQGKGLPPLLGWYARLGERSGEPALAWAQAAEALDLAEARRKGIFRATWAPLLVVIEAALVGLLAIGMFGNLVALAEEAMLW
jgi:type II secretory pathway component PulF